MMTKRGGSDKYSGGKHLVQIPLYADILDQAKLCWRDFSRIFTRPHPVSIYKNLAGGFRTKILGPSDESLLTRCCRNQIISGREKYFEFSFARVLGNIYGGRLLQKRRRNTEGDICISIFNNLGIFRKYW